MEYMGHEASKILGISVPTLQYYEKAGLLPPIKRNKADYRVYGEEDLEWIAMVMRMRESDLPIRKIREYVQLLLQGPATIKERQKLIVEFQEIMEQKIKAMQNTLKFFEAKAGFYQKVVERGVDLPCVDFSEEWALFKLDQEAES